MWRTARAHVEARAGRGPDRHLEPHAAEHGAHRSRAGSARGHPERPVSGSLPGVERRTTTPQPLAGDRAVQRDGVRRALQPHGARPAARHDEAAGDRRGAHGAGRSASAGTARRAMRMERRTAVGNRIRHANTVFRLWNAVLCWPPMTLLTLLLAQAGSGSGGFGGGGGGGGFGGGGGSYGGGSAPAGAIRCRGRGDRAASALLVLTSSSARGSTTARCASATGACGRRPPRRPRTTPTSRPTSSSAMPPRCSGPPDGLGRARPGGAREARRPRPARRVEPPARRLRQQALAQPRGGARASRTSSTWASRTARTTTEDRARRPHHGAAARLRRGRERQAHHAQGRRATSS